MHWELSDEQALYADSLRDWLGARAGSEQVRSWLAAGEQGAFDAHLIEEGWAGVGFDESVGGQGGGLLELALAAREFGRAAAPCAPWLARAVAAPALAGAPELASAAVENASALTVLAVRCDRIPAATPEWRGGVLTGEVPGVLAAGQAARFVVPARDPDGGTVLAVVDRESAGVQVRPRSLLDGSRSAADVVLAETPARALDAGGDARDALGAAARRAAVLVAADSLGAAERMLEMTVEYAKQRKQFGRQIAAFQAVKHAAAQMLVTVESCYSLALFAAASVEDDGVDSGLHAAAAKAQVSAHCADLADSALTVHGAIGYTWEYDLQLFYKRVKFNRTLFGTPESWNERIAQSLPLISA